ncbi:MAG TPA: PaaX family transcriptional regulator C-terminal domain-containing protein [Solirubrobacteraceae bacterium]|jgi:phenylacetic acid degradation operon negative regulatory protein|nr:PaaX family transcriptional regulator C-terminal domain-containing protein [Solirubrobacteraceae bacterium]
MDDQLRRRSVGAPAARSVLLTVLGEYVLPNGGGAWQATLIGALATMDYRPATARQALMRSVAAGWLETERRGRRSRCTLSAATGAMLQTGAERIYGFGDPRSWDGRWLVVVLRVPEEQRAVRHRVRTRLAWAGFGSLGGGLWISPYVDREEEVSALAAADTSAELLCFRAELGAVGQAREVVAEAWDLDALDAAYHEFIERFAGLRPKAPEAVFAVQTLLVHHWRKFPFLDPDLPPRMIPARAARGRALELFRERHERWGQTAQSYFRSLDAVAGA